MCKRFVHCLALVAFAALVTLTWVSGAGAVTPVAACGVLATAGETYNLTTDISTCVGACLTVAANNITINLKGFGIFSFCGGTAGITDGGVARLNTVVNGAPPPGPPPVDPDNGTIAGWSNAGIDLGASTRNTIRNIEVSNNSGDGIRLGTKSTVKACEVDENDANGIVIGDGGTVQDCVVGEDLESAGCSDGNGGQGIVGGHHMVITGNLVRCNGLTGIIVGDRSTVSFNNASLNGVAGITALDHSTVTGNTANGNGTTCGAPPCDEHHGIEAEMFSTVSNNTANNNADDGIGVGAHSTVTGNTADGNAEFGLGVDCPGTPPSGGTVTNNQASGNAAGNYEFDGTGCFTNNNT